MSQRVSGYAPVENDLFETPHWVTDALCTAETFPQPIWEPAEGSGFMTRALRRHSYRVLTSDIRHGIDFLKDAVDDTPIGSIVTNPPYSNGLAEKFVRHALKLTEPVQGKVAMLLPLAWDSAKGRRDLFAEHPAFKAKYTLTKRIRWANLEQKKNGPSQNHAWFIWDWMKPETSGVCEEPPIAGYLP